MSSSNQTVEAMRCTRCGHLATSKDKFCAECGMFLRDAYLDHRLLFALQHEREGRSRDARNELERILDTEPEHVLANHLLGTLLFHQGLLEGAVERYARAVAAAPAFVLGHYDLGVAWYHRGNMPKAIGSFRRCLEIDPQYNAAHYRLALSLFHAGELEEALEALRTLDDSHSRVPHGPLSHRSDPRAAQRHGICRARVSAQP